MSSVLGPEVAALRTPAAWSLVAHSPELREGTPGRLHFELAWESSGGSRLASVKGWSVYKGHVYPPVKRVGTHWFKLATWGGEGSEASVAEEYVAKLLKPWASEFPDVEFLVL